MQLIFVHICPQEFLFELKNRCVLLSQSLLQGILGGGKQSNYCGPN
jgi:hypothetical protein